VPRGDGFELGRSRVAEPTFDEEDRDSVLNGNFCVQPP